MLIKVKRGWELPESAATPEDIYLNRRQIVKALGIAPAIAASASVLPAGMAMAVTTDKDPSVRLYPVPRNEKFTLDRPITAESDATSYNNFSEFGSHKQISHAAQQLQIRPWNIIIDGMVEKEFEIGVDDLLKQVKLEERLYRHRCVEAWAMAVPWSGFQMSELVKLAKPLSGAKYIAMQTILASKREMPGLRQFWYPWPYQEGLTMEEANNELAFLVTGMYGKPVRPQNGAPIRLAVPWKYGFKSIKSVIRFTFTDEKPKTFWEALQPAEYGFWANVNPEVDHPRWSQASEWLLGGPQSERVPTQLYNGYTEFVAHIYPPDASDIYFR
ncbi:MAG: protein-methionine-sulfoxide reductase catalytic subunit MsrP [Alphaproteobacteria bacterium]|nr:protein-methionine-sulfoxide reductase catalytic subunit MsrP [Alphaproteobacteria bacterium]